MRCADPAGSPPPPPSKWQHVISMHADETRRPQAPLFNYATIRGGAFDEGGGAGAVAVAGISRDAEKGGGCTAGFPGRRSSGGLQLQRRRPGESAASRKSLAFAHSRTHVRTQTCARRHTSPRLRLNPCRTRPETVTFTALLLFNFLFLHSLPHTRALTLSILNSQAPVNQSELIAFAFLELRMCRLLEEGA